MSNYICPSCGGGFPEPGSEKECPWCGCKMDKSYGTATDTELHASLDTDAFAAGQVTQETGYTIEPAQVKFTEDGHE